MANKKEILINDRDEYIIDTCAGKRVLHTGATDWPLTKEKLNNNSLLYKEIDKVAVAQLGIDLDKESVDYLNGIGFKNSSLQVCDLNEMNQLDFNPEIIIFTETIEHLTNAGTALENFKQIMDEDSILIISTPNSYALNNFISALNHNENQHPDHSLAFTPKTLKQLLVKCGYQIDAFYFTFMKSSSDPRILNWKGRILSSVQRYLCKFFPMFSNNMLVVAKKKK